MSIAVRRVVLSLLLASAALCLVSGQAFAQSADLAVSATVVNRCVITTSALDFGDYNPLDVGALNGTGLLTVRCTRGSNVTISLDNGLNFNAGLRRMANGGEFLSYGLFQDAGRSTKWGPDAGDHVSHEATSLDAVNLTVYGQVGAGQNVLAGNYTDTVVATIHF